MLLPHGAVIAVVDGQNFELYRNAGDEAAPELAALPAQSLMRITTRAAAIIPARATILEAL